MRSITSSILLYLLIWVFQILTLRVIPNMACSIALCAFSITQLLLLLQPFSAHSWTKVSPKVFHCALSWAFLCHNGPVTPFISSTQRFCGLPAFRRDVLGFLCISLLVHFFLSPLAIRIPERNMIVHSSRCVDAKNYRRAIMVFTHFHTSCRNTTEAISFFPNKFWRKCFFTSSSFFKVPLCIINIWKMLLILPIEIVYSAFILPLSLPPNVHFKSNWKPS